MTAVTRKASLAELEAINAPQAKAGGCPANGDAAQRDGLIKKLQATLFTCRATDGDRALAGTKSVEPIPKREKQQKEAE